MSGIFSGVDIQRAQSGGRAASKLLGDIPENLDGPERTVMHTSEAPDTGSMAGQEGSIPTQDGSIPTHRAPVVRSLPRLHPLSLEQTDQALSEKTPRGVHLLSLARLRPAVTDERLATYLGCLMEVPHHELACYRAGLLPGQIKSRMKSDSDFAEAVEVARHLAAGVAEHEAHRRAIEGTDKGVYFQGIRVDTEKVYSDALLGRIMTAKLPEYANKTEVSGKIEHQVNWRELVQAVNATQTEPEPTAIPAETNG